MGQNQIVIPHLACPYCLNKYSVHHIDGETRIARHMRTCDADKQANGFIEASDCTGIESKEWNENWREYVSK